MGKGWRNCIVTLIDLVGVKSKAPSGMGSTLMRKLHQRVVGEVRSGKYSFRHVYAYNDAILVLSYVDKMSKSFQTAMHNVDALKKKIDTVQMSYAIAVKGRAFPLISNDPVGDTGFCVTVIEASSWAMANCFEIEKKLGNLKKPWYVDKRIATHIRTDQLHQTHNVQMHPMGQQRSIYVYEGYLWSDGCG